MIFLKQWWPVFTSSLVLLLGVLLFTSESTFGSSVDWSNPESVLMGRTLVVSVQLVVSALSIYGLRCSFDGHLPSFTRLGNADMLPIALALAVITDIAIGLVLSTLGWIRIDELIGN